MKIKYTIKDLMKALNYMQNEAKAMIVDLEINDMGRIEISARDVYEKDIKITIFRAGGEENTGGLTPEITETRRLP